MRERPLVDLVIDEPPAQVLHRLETGLADCKECLGHVGRSEVSFYVAEPHRHVFSPYLSLEVRPSPQGSRLRGRFGPEPHLWTLFLAIYASFLAVVAAGSVYGSVQVALGLGYSGLLVSAAALLGLGVACGVDLIGRSRGARQMHHIRQFIGRTLPEAEPASPEP